MEFKNIFKGLDSLYVSFNGTLKEGLTEFLNEKKTLAQSDDEKKQALATMDIEDHHFEVIDKGAGYYTYILADNWYQIKITASKKQKVPTIYVQIKSELLNRAGHEYSIYKLREIVSKLLVLIEEEKVSRADIFVDFVTDADIERIEEQSLVTKTRKKDKHWYGGFTGWSLGLGGIISARLYDKTVEIKKSQKDYLIKFWEYGGWDPSERVWRLEFQLKREFLGQMHIKTYSDLLSKTNDIWQYCTCNWLKLAIDDDTQNRTRWEIDPLWKAIQGVRFLDGAFTGVKREVNKERIPSDKTLYQNGIIGYTTSFAAREGLDDIDEKAVIKCWNEALDHLKRETRGKDKEYLSSKINLKKKRYNKVLSKTTGHIANLTEKPQP